MKKLFVFAAFCCSLGVSAAVLTYEQKVSELLELATTIQSQYGPYDYKKQTQKISPEELLAHYIKLAKGTDNEGFYYLVNQYVAEFKDSHFGSRVQTDYVAKLGFAVDRVEGKAVIEEVDRQILPLDKFPFDRGDEVVALGNRPVNDIVEELATYVNAGFRETALRSATFLLTTRAAAVAPAPSGDIAVTLKKRATGETTTVTLPWKFSGTPVGDAQADSAPAATDYLDLSVDNSLAGLPGGENKFRCSGITRIAIPKDATVLMKEPFVAYYYPTAKGNVGYLRIPHYYWRNAATGASENDARFRQYEWAVNELEKNTVGLIIDQDHNCGGAVDMVEQMVGLFAQAPFQGLTFQFLSSRREYLTFKTWADSEKFTLAGAQTNEVLSLMRAAASQGQRLTAKTTFHGATLVQPNLVRYTKPIIVLIDEMSGSGGDAFPSMMQGIGRAKLLGTRTMGAGGHVEEIAPLSFSANKVRITKSLFYRPDGVAVENNGATPDFSYSPTIKDYTDGYLDYQKFYTEKLLGLLP